MAISETLLVYGKDILTFLSSVGRLLMDILKAVQLLWLVLILYQLLMTMMWRFYPMRLQAGKDIEKMLWMSIPCLTTLLFHLPPIHRRLLKKRQRWYRCLDAGYLSLKVFLLERFLHDILFESSNPQILRDFVGVNSSEASKLNTKGWKGRAWFDYTSWWKNWELARVSLVRL